MLFCVWLSLAVLAAVGAVLVPGSERLVRRVDGTLRLVEPLLPWVALAGFVIAFLATRFRKSLGIPVVVLALVAVIALGLFFQSVRAFTGETEIATVKALTVADGKMRLEVQPEGRPSEMVDLDGDQFAPVVKVVIFDDLWVFLGATQLVPVRRPRLVHDPRRHARAVGHGLEAGPSHRHLRGAVGLVRGLRGAHPGREDGADASWC